MSFTKLKKQGWVKYGGDTPDWYAMKEGVYQIYGQMRYDKKKHRVAIYPYDEDNCRIDDELISDIKDYLDNDIKIEVVTR